RTTLDQAQDAVCSPVRSSGKETRFRKHRFTSEQRRDHLAQLRAHPIMPLVTRINERRQRPRIPQDPLYHLPYPSMYLGFVDKSAGPSQEPTRSPASSSADMGRSPARNCSSAVRTTSDLLWPRFLAARSNLTLKLAGSFKDRVFTADP